MKALILAAGYGTRLYPLTKNKPKPLLDVANKPLVNHILEKLVPLKGLDEVIVVSNDKFFGIFQKWASSKKTAQSFPFRIKIVNDGTKTPEDRLGSIGDIDFVIKTGKIDEDLLVLGGDNLFDYSLGSCIDFAKTKSPAVTIGLFDIQDKKAATIYGVVEISPKDGKVVSFEEKPKKPKSSLIAMCFYYLPKKSLPYLRQYIHETKKTDKAGDYIQWLSTEKEVYGFKFSGKWYDIGSIEAYNEAQKEFA